jgi:hypothetical protein
MHRLKLDPEAPAVETFGPAAFVDVAETTSSPTPETTDGPWFCPFACRGAHPPPFLETGR